MEDIRETHKDKQREKQSRWFKILLHALYFNEGQSCNTLGDLLLECKEGLVLEEWGISNVLLLCREMEIGACAE